MAVTGVELKLFEEPVLIDVALLFYFVEYGGFFCNLVLEKDKNLFNCTSLYL